MEDLNPYRAPDWVDVPEFDVPARGTQMDSQLLTAMAWTVAVGIACILIIVFLPMVVRY